MSDIENKVIQKQDDFKGLELSTEGALRLTSPEIGAIQDAAKGLTDNGVSVFDKNCQIIKMNDGALGIFKNTENGMRCALLISGGSRETTRNLAKQVIEYQNNIERRQFLETVQASVDQQNIIISVKEDLGQIMNKSEDDVGNLIHNTYEVYAQAEGAIKAANKSKNTLDAQQQANVNMLNKILDDQRQRLIQTTTDFQELTGRDAKKYGSKAEINPNKLKDLSRDYTAKLILAKQYSELSRTQGYLTDIKVLAADTRFKNGEYPLSHAITDFGIHRLGKAEELTTLLEKNLQIDKKKSENMMKIAVAQLSDEDFKDLTNYLEASALSVKDPSKQAFVKENLPKVEKIVEKYPELKQYGILERIKDVKSRTTEVPQLTPGHTPAPGTNASAQGVEGNAGGANNPAAAENKKYNDTGEAFAQGGIYGVIDHWTEGIQGKDPRTQQFYKNFGNAALTVGGIYLGWKVLRNAFRVVFGKEEDIKKNNSRAWVLGGAGFLLASGGRPGELFRGGEITQNLMNLVGGGAGAGTNTANIVKNEVPNGANTEVQKLYGITKSIVLFDQVKFSELGKYISEDNGKMVLDKQGMKTALEAQKASGTLNPTELKAVEDKLKVIDSLGEDKSNIIDLALNSLGISYDTIKNNGDKTFNDFAADPLARLGTIGTKMEEKKYVAVDTDDPDKKLAFELYIKKGTPTWEDLEAAGVFRKANGEFSGAGLVNIPNTYWEEEDAKKGKIATAVNTLKTVDAAEKPKIVRAGVEFWNAFPTAESNRTMSIREDANGHVFFKTYGKETELVFKTRSMPGFRGTDNTGNIGDYGFDSYLELMKAANLTNRIKNICDGKQAKSLKPFKSTAVYGISFDDAETISLDFDTRIVSSGRGGALKDISPTLEAHKDDYCNYLNDPKIVSYTAPAKA